MSVIEVHDGVNLSLQNEVSEMSFNITCCHPGYKFNEELAQCEIDDVNNRFIVRPHPRGRYFYAQVYSNLTMILFEPSVLEGNKT